MMKKKLKMKLIPTPQPSELNNLPPEIIHDILTKVPVKSLSRCRRVCKSWLKTTRNRQFISTFMESSLANEANRSVVLQRGRTFRLIDCDHQTCSLRIPEVPYLVPTDYSSNGFLLLIARTPINRFLNYFTYCICNPITRDYIIVPRSPLFDQSDELSVGFGYDPEAKLCKLVRVFTVSNEENGGRAKKVEVYDAVKKKWRVMEGENVLIKSLHHDPGSSSVGGNENKVFLDSMDLINSNFRPSVFVNGAIHWLGYNRGTGEMAVISFKLDTEEFYESQVPFRFDKPRNDLLTSERQPYLVVVRECLSVVHIVGSHESIEIWVMKDFGMNLTWERKYVISSIVMDNGDPIQGPYMPVDIMKNGEILMLCSLSKKMGYYQPLTRVVKFLQSIDLSDYHWRPLLHVCSLRSLEQAYLQ